MKQLMADTCRVACSYLGKLGYKCYLRGLGRKWLDCQITSQANVIHVEGGALFITMRAAQWSLKTKKLKFWGIKITGSSVLCGHVQ